MNTQVMLASEPPTAPTATTESTGFERPIPQPQTEAAELWFGLASLALCVALYFVHRVVSRR